MILSEKIGHLAKSLWFSKGKTIEETAIILGITSRTVKAQIESIKQKSGCINKFQLGLYFSKFILS